MQLTFKKWLEMFSPVPFPVTNIARNPYINGQWSTCAFPTGKSKTKSKKDKKKDDARDGYHL